MKLFLLIPILALFLIPQALGLALGVPNVGEILFEPGKTINLEYRLNNNLPKDLPVLAQLSVPEELEAYVNISKNVNELKANSAETVVITIKFPNDLPYGLFSLSFTAIENAATAGAFVAHVGASHSVYILHPYPTGKAAITYTGPELFTIEDAPIQFKIRNIGQTDLEDQRYHIIITDGTHTQETYTERITIPAIGSQTINLPIKLEVPPGVYNLTIQTTSLKESSNTKIRIGSPTIKVTNVAEHSFEKSIMPVTILNDWPEALPESTVVIIMNDERGRKIMEASKTGVVLPPKTETTIELRALKSRFIADGNYTATVQVLSPPFLISAPAEVTVKLTELGRMLKSQNITEDPWEYEQVPLDTPRLVEISKTKPMLLLIIVLAIAIFLFSIAMLFRKKKNEEAQT